MNYRDSKTKGLILVASYGGSKTFYLYRKINGRPERIKLGGFPDISVEKARQMAAKFNGSIAEGKNPQDEKRSFKSEMTLGELFKVYMERYSKKQKRSWQYDEREIPKFLSHWFSRKISTIKRQEIQTLHEKICDNNGLYQANRILERIRAIYNKAIEWGWLGTNPAIGIKKFKEKARDRFLQPNELPRFFASLDQEDDLIRDYILISLFTGARKSNVLSMRWEEIDFVSQTWRIPETKNGEPVTIALVVPAIKILERRKQNTNSEFVFSSNSRSGHLADPKRAWDRVLKNAKIDDLHIHDLRRTLGSYLAASGANSYIIGKSLGHKSQQATAIYARLNLDPVRQSVELATAAISDFATRKS